MSFSAPGRVGEKVVLIFVVVVVGFVSERDLNLVLFWFRLRGHLLQIVVVVVVVLGFCYYFFFFNFWRYTRIIKHTQRWNINSINTVICNV